MASIVQAGTCLDEPAGRLQDTIVSRMGSACGKPGNTAVCPGQPANLATCLAVLRLKICTSVKRLVESKVVAEVPSATTQSVVFFICAGLGLVAWALKLTVDKYKNTWKSASVVTYWPLSNVLTRDNARVYLDEYVADLRYAYAQWNAKSCWCGRTAGICSRQAPCNVCLSREIRTDEGCDLCCPCYAVCLVDKWWTKLDHTALVIWFHNDICSLFALAIACKSVAQNTYEQGSGVGAECNTSVEFELFGSGWSDSITAFVVAVLHKLLGQINSPLEVALRVCVDKVKHPGARLKADFNRSKDRHPLPNATPRTQQWRFQAFVLVVGGIAYVIAAARLAGRSSGDFGLVLGVWLVAYVLAAIEGFRSQLTKSVYIWCWAETTDLPDESVEDVELGDKVTHNPVFSMGATANNKNAEASGTAVVAQPTHVNDAAEGLQQSSET